MPASRHALRVSSTSLVTAFPPLVSVYLAEIQAVYLAEIQAVYLAEIQAVYLAEIQAVYLAEIQAGVCQPYLQGSTHLISNRVSTPIFRTPARLNPLMIGKTGSAAAPLLVCCAVFIVAAVLGLSYCTVLEGLWPAMVWIVWMIWLCRC